VFWLGVYGSVRPVKHPSNNLCILLFLTEHGAHSTHVSEWVGEYSCTSHRHRTDNRSFRRRVFPGNKTKNRRK